MHGYPVFVQYSMAPPGCGWAPPPSLEPVRSSSTAPLSTGVKKYVVWCLISGGCSCLLGTMFLGVYFLLRSYTSTVGYFETVPTFVPATLLILTGLCIITLARRRNRYSFLIKLAGVCGLASSLVCALVTVTTTVLHMSRLQALSECEYSTKAKTCTCYSAPPERPLESDRESVTFVFDSTSDCGLVHGALYSCLRAIFGLSVAGVLVAVFSCMLVYQLLTHERKKMYWEQLELRCRSLYESQHLPTTIPSSQLNGPSIIGGPPLTTINGCRCCEQCHAHRQSTNLTGPAASAWESANRFWAAAALTSGGGQSIQTTAGNFYSPNPGSDELNNMISGSNTNNTTNNGNQNNNQNNTSDNLNNSNNQSNRSTGWSWPKMPWQKNNNNTNTSNSNNTSNSGNVNHNTRLFRQSPSSPDSQYGFSQNPTTVTGVGGIITTSDGTNIMMTTNGIPNQQTSYSIIGGLPYGVWGPPPPYSDPNSPARRPGNGINSINPTTGLLNSSGRYQYIHQNQCPSMLEHQMHQQAQQQSITNLECHQQNNSSSADGNSVMEHFNTSQQQNRNLIKRQTGLKSKDNYENTLSDSDGSRDRFSNSLPVRKMKKRIESLTKNNISSSNNNCKNQSRNNQNVFQPINSSDLEEPEYHEPRNPGDEELNSSPTNISSSSSAGATTNQINSMQQPKCNKRIKTGIDNTAFQGPDSAENNTVHHIEPSTESEVYFADVSSCCNVSVKNDSYYEDANQRPCQDQEIPDSKEETEDYLAQRFGKRENSIRSRLPFPQNTVNSKVSSHSETFDKNQMNLPIINTRQNQIPKDISRQSMCSVDSGEKTDFTDLSPATPCTNNSYLTQQDHVNNFNLTNNNNNTADLKTINDSFIASYPFSSNEQCQEAHRRSTKNLQDMFLAPDAQYEIIKETNQFESTPLTLAFDEELNNSSNTNNFNNQNNNISNNNINSNNNSNNNINNSSSNNNIIKNNKTTSHQIKSPKNLSLTPLNRSNIGANITSIIQNLSSSEAGLLYPDNRISNNSSVTRDNFSDQENHEGKILKIQGHNILNHKKQQSSQQPIPLSNSDNEWSDSSDRRL